MLPKLILCALPVEEDHAGQLVRGLEAPFEADDVRHAGGPVLFRGMIRLSASASAPQNGTARAWITGSGRRTCACAKTHGPVFQE